MWKFLKGIFGKSKAIDVFEAATKDSELLAKGIVEKMPKLTKEPFVKPVERIAGYRPKEVSTILPGDANLRRLAEHQAYMHKLNNAKPYGPILKI